MTVTKKEKLKLVSNLGSTPESQEIIEEFLDSENLSYIRCVNEEDNIGVIRIRKEEPAGFWSDRDNPEACRVFGFDSRLWAVVPKASGYGFECTCGSDTRVEDADLFELVGV